MPAHLAIVTPCYNEEESILIFLSRLEANLSPLNIPISIILVDDCSQDKTPDLISSFHFSSPLLTLRIIRMKFNVGHQQAIFQALLYAHEIKVDRAIIMDSDGEDDPRAIPLLLKITDYHIVEVRRGKRSEKLSFKILYTLYKMLFYFITGKNMNYGNYCMISRDIIERITCTSYIHFPAYLLKQRVSRTYLISDRGKRIRGESKLGFNGLLAHSFKSFVEFGEDLLMLFLKGFVIIVVALFVILIIVLYQKFISQEALLGWTSTVVLVLLNIAILCFGFFVIGILLLNLMHQKNFKEQKLFYVIQN